MHSSLDHTSQETAQVADEALLLAEDVALERLCLHLSEPLDRNCLLLLSVCLVSATH